MCCYTFKSLCCGSVTLEKGSSIFGFLKLIIDLGLLCITMMSIRLKINDMESATTTFVFTCFCVFFFDLLLVLKDFIDCERKTILAWWLIINICLLLINTFLSIYIALNCQFEYNCILYTRNGNLLDYGIISFSIYCLNTLYGYFLCCVVHSLFLEIRSSMASETNVEMTQQQSVSERRISYLRTPSLPTYDNVMCSESSEKLETPPPKFDQISFQS